MRMVEVAPGIHAALQDEARRFSDSNAAVVVTEAGAVLVDGPQRLVAVDWLDAWIEAVPSGSRRVLITTHWHLDHSLGGAHWRSSMAARGHSVEHWGHAGLEALLAERGAEQLAEHIEQLQQMRRRGTAMQQRGARDDGTELTAEQKVQLDEQLANVDAQLEAVPGLALAAPTDRVTEVTRVELGTVTLELHPVEAHTDADLVVFIPEAGVLITGDVLDEIPYGGHGHPRRWLATLEQLATLEATTIIPGHGPLLGPEHVTTMIALWTALLQQAMLAVQQTQTPADRYAAWSKTPEHEALREALVTDDVAARNFDRFIPDALARAVADIQGEL